MEILSANSTIVDLKGETKEAIIEELVDALEVGKVITDKGKVLKAVLEREKVMSTGIGDGIAIPHGKSDAVIRLAAALGTQRRGVEFEALDGEAAYVFFLLVSPANISGPHIKALARISRLLKNDDFKKKLIASSTAEEVISAIEMEEKKLPAS
jgi:fructose-specific phosphotransferase system IIA component